ncbi:hypothetical protein TFKS16_1817 [Tannerella forsythia KS16]|uniref:Uncharacterized protein n=1 Tax=Tannerella forsythia (strain ATCC 43037 / JCM 10827 / CCUG 21028 A / KCTC 5666 / FDC 338) TaxID=203275 RepID=G8UQS8_TANFA|nr:hypothetical protein BFO_2028 [Tannerella forsythia 92A2]BAR49351.1 hypothetical protein TF3313_1867 [Tannerella forsythia 3313]BAR52043.1 hypothetical protein TFKS16_1817 [Tannerella forsythia KS16]
MIKNISIKSVPYLFVYCLFNRYRQADTEVSTPTFLPA